MPALLRAVSLQSVIVHPSNFKCSPCCMSLQLGSCCFQPLVLSLCLSASCDVPLQAEELLMELTEHSRATNKWLGFPQRTGWAFH